MQILVIGCGSIGERHIRNLCSLGLSDIGAVDPLATRLDTVARNYDVRPHGSLQAGLEKKPDAVLVCTPPHSHIPVAKQAVSAGCHVFIEKPLSNTLDGVDEFLADAAVRGRIVYVGYNLRFHTGLRRLKQRLDEDVIGRPMNFRAEFGQYLPDWRPKQDYRQSYTAHAALGGGILLDASHELDYVRWLGGEVESVSCVAGKFSGLEIDVEDMAEITLRIKGNVIADVHLDCLQREYVRACKVVGEKGTLIWDMKQGVRHYDASTAKWEDEPIAPDPNDMYVEEMKHFVSCVRGEASPLVDGVTGKRVLEIALAAKKSSRERCEVSL
jgi:predicted dehydrogenase